MQHFYVTFGMGTILSGYYLTVQAVSYDVVAAWLDNREKVRWSNIKTEIPSDSKPLRDAPVTLFYSAAEHIA